VRPDGRAGQGESGGAVAARLAHTGYKMAAHAEEVRVDPSSDPGRDEYGLPPVDIEVPDDARDLDRDVQAYHRELRAQRRRMRVLRLTRPLTRHGMVIPLVAGCLALTLLSGTLLTVLAGRQATPRPARTSAAGKRHPTSSSSPLPNASVVVAHKSVKLRALGGPAVLAWVPTACGCLAALRQLAAQAAHVHVKFYLVGTGPAVQELQQLAGQVQNETSPVLADNTDAIGRTYNPMMLTAILVDSSGKVGDGDVVPDLTGADSTREDAAVIAGLRSLAGASTQPTIEAPSPSGGVSPPS
jgi:hypothetical protein